LKIAKLYSAAREIVTKDGYSQQFSLGFIFP
jgi:hypothetical protein